MKVIENRKIWFIISLFIIVAGFISLIFRGLNYDIEFAGGTIIQIDMQTPGDVEAPETRR